jgi:hypothetical protein
MLTLWAPVSRIVSPCIGVPRFGIQFVDFGMGVSDLCLVWSSVDALSSSMALVPSKSSFLTRHSVAYILELLCLQLSKLCNRRKLRVAQWTDWGPRFESRSDPFLMTSCDTDREGYSLWHWQCRFLFFFFYWGYRGASNCAYYGYPSCGF